MNGIPRLASALVASLLALALTVSSAWAQTPEGGEEAGLSDQQVLEAAARAAGACPVTDVPPGWQTLWVGGQGCTVRVPPSWQLESQGASAVATNDATHTAGYGYMFTSLPGTHWTAETMGDEVVELLRRQGTPGIRVIRAETDESFAALGVWTRTLIVRFERAGLDEVGTIRVTFQGCQPVLNSCSVMASIAWAPVEQLPEYVCTLMQVEGSGTCPEPRRTD